MVWKAENVARNNVILRMRKEGYSLQSIGNTVDRSRERVRQILAQHERREKRPKQREARDGSAV